MTPIYRNVPSDELAACQIIPELNNKWLCVHFLVRSDAGRSVLTDIQFNQNPNEQPIQFDLRPDGFDMAISTDYLKRIGNAIFEEFT